MDKINKSAINRMSTVKKTKVRMTTEPDKITHYPPEIEEFHVGFEFEKREQGSDPIYEDDGITIRSHSISTIEVARKKYVLKSSKDFTPWQKCDNYNEKFGDYDEHPLPDLEREIKAGRIRVKYLDREDIESEGWKSLEPQQKTQTEFYELSFKGSNRLVKMNRNNPGRPGTLVIFEPGVGILFHYGIIKNKSEFSRILKQLGLHKPETTV